MKPGTKIYTVTCGGFLPEIQTGEFISQSDGGYWVWVDLPEVSSRRKTRVPFVSANRSVAVAKLQSLCLDHINQITNHLRRYLGE